MKEKIYIEYGGKRYSFYLDKFHRIWKDKNCGLISLFVSNGRLFTIQIPLNFEKDLI